MRHGDWESSRLSARTRRSGTHSCAQNQPCIRQSLVPGPGHEVIGAHEHAARRIALAAAAAAVADDLERDLEAIGLASEGARNRIVPIEAEEREALAQPLEDAVARGERLGREMVTCTRPKGMSAERAAAPPGRPP